MAVQFAIVGVQATARAFGAIAARLARVTVPRAVNRGANRLRRGMQDRAPRRTGALRSAIRVVAAGPGRVTRRGLRGSAQRGLFRAEILYVGPDLNAVDYAGHVEYGTATHPAQPYVRAAYSELGYMILAGMAQDIEADLKRFV